ncbi:hypothetical protein ACMU_06840 [Actibacterium mucosum KCTC 23349]|uniref:ABM domain-containing protein n=1 Tax=Actibacterium mucosum KCTC 23349 TaxID=1454373 RepID=A0A037ZLX8_9RHOB|nr:antibiotic biosynthesis monooxygenase [Actibacterium mucosum]KAJ56654.1 hypothetical protein ACMU_06840 [Actibacterium mucosum KCTC 23349]
MITRIWHGYTTPENADAYQAVVTGEVIPGIIAMNIPGFERIELMRRDLQGEVEFITIMWFTSLDAVRAFMGADYAQAHVPAAAQAVLSRFDDRSQHYEVQLSQDV